MRPKSSLEVRRAAAWVCGGALLGLIPVLSTAAPAQSVKAWREAMRHTPPPMVGCFHASYPSLTWIWQACGTAHYRPNPPVLVKRPQQGEGFAQETVGNGNDYAAVTSSLISSATGSFPVTVGLSSETGTGQPGYMLQLNTNVSPSSTPACGAYGYQSCQVWEQFIYSSDYTTTGTPQVFIQNWLYIPAGTSCPAGWITYVNSSSRNGCFENSGAVTVPSVPVTELSSLKLSGSAVTNGADTVTFTDGTSAYAVSELDSTLDISYAWNQSEFNVVGNADLSQAQFNSGTEITVELQVNDGSTSAPTCAAGDGSTGETNNLNLGPCSAYGGTDPYIEFTEWLGVWTPQLSAVPIGQYPGLTEYQLRWTAEPGATYYELWYQSGGLPWGPTGKYPGPTLDQGVASGQVEYYRVQACDASSCSGLSNQVRLVYR